MAELRIKPQPKFADPKQYELFQERMEEINLQRDPAESERFLRRMEGIGRNREFLSAELYAQLRTLAPILCIDVFLVLTGPDGETVGVLMGRRAEEDKAAENRVWPIGGRAFYRERPEDTLAYTVFKETELHVELMGDGPIGVGWTRFTVGEKGRVTLNATCLARVVGGELKPSEYFSEYVLVDREAFENNPKTHYLCDYVYGLLKASGVLTGNTNPGEPLCVL